ncbi:MAG: hypothetical protein PWQ37_1227 [Candidatus Petromonas sp.]|nr:hypothetical protein [Candidatus Petromonas sp.]
MDKRVYARVSTGLEVLMRVVGVLRRKRFNVKGVNMVDATDSKFADLIITLEDEFGLGVQQAINQMEKLIDVYEVKELV